MQALGVGPSEQPDRINWRRNAAVQSLPVVSGVHSPSQVAWSDSSVRAWQIRVRFF